MKTLLIVSLLCLASVGAAPASEAGPAVQFLRFIYGAENVAIETHCWPNDDIWMLAGPKNPGGLEEIEKTKISKARNTVLWESIDRAICLIEVREGRVDPAFNLDQVYFRHRQTVLRFVYAALGQDNEELAHVVTDVANVKFGGAPRPARGDMGVYQDIVMQMPVVRSSLPATDKSSRSITYRIPLGDRGFSVRLIKKDGQWLVDTRKAVTVPLALFFK